MFFLTDDLKMKLSRKSSVEIFPRYLCGHSSFQFGALLNSEKYTVLIAFPQAVLRQKIIIGSWLRNRRHPIFSEHQENLDIRRQFLYNGVKIASIKVAI